MIRALQADKPVLVEKPLCLNTEEFDAIAKAAWEHGVPCVEAVMAAYHPWQAALADLIDSEQYGALQETHTQINVSTKQLPPNNYRFFAEYGGGGYLGIPPAIGYNFCKAVSA